MATTTSEEPAQQATLAIDGMTCASCAVRIERRLNRLDGVSASVNFASEQAAISFDPAQASVGTLIRAVESAGYHASLPDGLARHSAGGRDLRPRLFAAFPLSVALVLITWIPGLHFAGWRWLALALATPVVAYSGWPFHRAAATGATHLAASMDTLVSIGTLAAFSWSVVVLLTGLHEAVYFDAAALITTFILLGRYFEVSAKRRSADSIRQLLELGAKQARVLRDGEEVLVDTGQLEVGELFIARPGEKLATDGVVEAGSSALDVSLLTGEPLPVEVSPGDHVTGATINLTGRLVVRATHVGSDTALAQIARLVGEAQSGKAPVQRLADRVSAVFVPFVIIVSLLTLTGWLAAGATVAAAFTAAVAVIVVACPCALGLATPMALMAGAGRGAQLGILIGSPEVLERTRQATTIVLDKTGTLTEGRMAVSCVLAAPGEPETDVLRLAGAAEDASEHPLAQAIAQHARATLGALPTAERFESVAGGGVKAVVDGHTVLVGRRGFLADLGVRAPAALTVRLQELEQDANSVVMVAWDGSARGLIAASDRLKPTSREAVSELKALGLEPVMLTGDNEHAAAAVASQAGISRVLAGVLPDQKAAEVARLQRHGELVAMAGDGINDAPALAQADLGLALGTGADIAMQVADVTLVSGDLRAVADAIRLSRRTLATIKGNLFWAFAYNVAAIPLASAGVLSPVAAAAAMSLSSVFVVSNSLRLRRFQPKRASLG